MSNFKSVNLLALLVVLAVGVLAGWLLSGHSPTSTTAHEDMASHGEPEKKPLYWVAPMDPNFRRDKPGKSPMGMDLVPVYEDASAEKSGPGISIDPAIAANLGMRTAVASSGQLVPHIETVGYVEYDERGMTMVHTRAEGWIERLRVSAEGDPVKKGQPLFDLFSPKLVSAQQEYLTALKSGNDLLTKAARERLKSLGLSDSARARLERDHEVQERIVQYSPQSGVVETLAVREGMFVMPGTHTLTLANLDTAWVQVEIFERDAGKVQKGQQALARLDAYPGEVWEGQVDYVYPEVNPTTRTVRVRLAFPNTQLRLKPNMFARVEVETQARPSAVLVPSAAVIRSGTGSRVVVAHPDNRFEVLPVQLGMESGGQVEVLAGIDAGTVVVTSAQFLIDSEANIGAESTRMTTPDAMTDKMEMQP